LDIQELVDQLKSNNNAILKTLFEEHAEHCIKQLLSKTNITRDEANDIFIESIVNFREKMISGKITHLTNLKGYLYTTCYNMALVRYEQQKRLKRNLKDVERFFYEYTQDAEEHQHTLLVSLKEGWDKIGEKCKEILTCYYADNLTMAEIAVKFSFSSEDVAKTSKSRCLKMLKGYVKEFVKF
jgi:RNA polymerase sigma factor (sigma-70 family)